MNIFNSLPDIDECSTNKGGCHADADCTNRVGSHSCKCKAGFRGNGMSCAGKLMELFIYLFILCL